MKSRAWMGVLAAGIAFAMACGHSSNPGGDGPLLLLEDGPAEDETLLVDNSRCFVCHLNFSNEELVLTHARKGVGCETCHGPSDEHCGDENNITPPDIMFAQDKVNSYCLTCHAKEKLEEKKEHKRLFAGKSKEKYCTDCHGKHRIENRTRRWDKETGELIGDDGVRMMKEDAFEEM